MAVPDFDEVNAVRLGECRMCGECCKRLGWLLVHADEGTLEWIRARDSQIKVEPAPDVVGYYYISLPYPCQHLTDLGDGRFSCGMHGSKPGLCKRYPEPDDDLKPGCGYAFKLQS